MIRIYEERLVTISIEADYFNVCDRIHWVMRRWGKDNFKLGVRTPWEQETMKFQFWVILHPRDADRAIDEIWQAAQGVLDINNLAPI
jgi:hypothetical protein